MGIKFLNLQEENRIRIEEFIRAFKAKVLAAGN
jgi:hypothetical protein